MTYIDNLPLQCSPQLKKKLRTREQALADKIQAMTHVNLASDHLSLLYEVLDLAELLAGYHRDEASEDEESASWASVLEETLQSAREDLATANDAWERYAGTDAYADRRMV